ncbi:M14 family metallopeptidase [Pontibacter ramchanderi]|uniref:Zinc carboxypeptidase n=1 Tax=Pontibacter ramchanderi TaxID=1179743 RepID=A0A2N3V3A2_9BACT|nr:M14 family metallopeptidase [Pontibacter ramchanderi]PKV76109.1 zinc carboxypeptidase [Pontibacter ramchanderi]
MNSTLRKSAQALLSTLLLWALLVLPSVAQNSYYFPKTKNFDPAIPTPEQFLGYGIGERQTRYDRVVAYLQELARLSDKASIEIIGYTYEHRPQVILTITAPQNHGRLEQIRQEHLQLADPAKAAPALANMPVLVHLGYNVHGNESSSTEVSMLTAYYLVANRDPETQRYLQESVVFIDPALNPDGRDRHTNWVNMHQGNPAVSDPADREHNEVWPGGRGNHYWFDLNRDWLPIAHVESQNRLEFYHKWLPNVVIDFHEMGTNSTYYFEPSKPYSSENRLIPRSTYDGLNVLLAKYHAEALDELGSLYFTKEQYDNIYPGYGSTYPDFQGGVGITFEQASSRGNKQENSLGVLTFAFTIRNHLATGLATVKASVENRETLLKHQREFYQSAITDGRKNGVRAYVYGENYDATRLRKFTELLLAHRIEVYELEKSITADGKKFEKGKAYVVPTEQPQYRLVESIFAKTKEFDDSVFYDASTWTLALAYNLPHAGLKSKATTGKRVTELATVSHTLPAQSRYAYLLDWADYNAAGALYLLQEKGVVTQTVFKPFTANTPDGPKAYQPGAITIPVASQKISADSLYKVIQEVAEKKQVRFASVKTGLSVQGIDLGSNNIHTLKKPEALILTGQGITSYEVGEVWFLLDQQLHMPISKVDLSAFARLNLARYNTIVLVSGAYNSLDKTAVDRLKRWVADGGTLITFKSASEWAIKQGIAQGKIVPARDTASKVARIDFANAAPTEGAQSVGGSIYEVDLDTSHPLGFGFTNRKLPVYRNSTTILTPAKNPYSTVAQYTKDPWLSGYVSKGNLRKISNSAALLVSDQGQGRVILFADNPNFRGTWYGTNKLFFNAIFFGSVIRTPGTGIAAE